MLNKNGANYERICTVFISNLQRLLFQLLHVFVDVAEFVGDADVLRAVGNAGAAADAVGGLAFWFNDAVVTDEETAAGFRKVFILSGDCDVAFVHALVIMREGRRDVNSIRTRHTILTRCAGYERELYELVGDVFKEFVVLLGARVEGAERRKIVLKMLHVGHARKYRKDVWVRRNPAERPRGDAVFRATLAQNVLHVSWQFCKSSAEDRLHHKNGDVLFVKTVVEVFSVGV